MNTGGRATLYVAGLAVAFVAALGLGSALSPTMPAAASADAGAHDESKSPGGNGAMDGMDMEAVSAAKGLSITDQGYTLLPLTDSLTAGGPAVYRFRVVGPDGQPLTRYTTSHTKDLHLIVVRRDLSGFQHLHPQLSDDGTWSLPLTVDRPGTYRVFADFIPAGHPGDSLTLAADLTVAGDAEALPLPPEAATAEVDGYTVSLAGRLVSGQASPLTLTVSRGGKPVTDLQPYLGAFGHLVALRRGDLGYLHVHPHGEASAAVAGGPDIRFDVEVPTAGTYRLYLDFQHNGAVHTAEFTVTV